MKIAIIDEGIDSNHPRLEGCIITGNSIYDTSVEDENNDLHTFSDLTGHGTAIASIIHKIVPKAHLHAIRLVKHNNKISEEHLAKAIQACLVLEELKIVNISMGIAMDSPSTNLYNYCKELNDRGVHIVVAAHNFPNIKCYPAHFPFVYSVGCGLIKNRMSYRFREYEFPKVLAKGGMQRIAWKNKGYKISSGTSYATAHFSGILAKMIDEGEFEAFETIDYGLKKHSDQNIEEYLFAQRNYNLLESGNAHMSDTELNNVGLELFTENEVLDVDKIAVFPYSEKEIKTIIELKDNSSKQIIFAIDYPKSISVKSIIDHGGGIDFINRLPKDKELDLFDTIVLGYFMDYPVESNIMFGLKLVHLCAQQNKNFIVFDNDVYLSISKIISTNYPAYSGTIHFTALHKDKVAKIRKFKHLNNVTVPVLAYIGTGSKQGKFTGQMIIKRILKKYNYKVAHLSSEPQGIALEAAFVFPFGHNANVELKSREWTSCLDTIMRGIQHFNKPNMIITGIQGGILPRSFHLDVGKKGNILNPLQYLLGVNPDAIICAIHPTDSVHIIKQTIQTVENYCGSNCLFYTINPFYTEIEIVNNVAVKKTKTLTRKEMKSLKEKYTSDLNLPVVDVMDPDDEPIILDCILKFFS